MSAGTNWNTNLKVTLRCEKSGPVAWQARLFRVGGWIEKDVTGRDLFVYIGENESGETGCGVVMPADEEEAKG
jgi:hypothetical protein